MSLDGGGFGFAFEVAETEPAGRSGSGKSILEVSPGLGKSEDGLPVDISMDSLNLLRTSVREFPD